MSFESLGIGPRQQNEYDEQKGDAQEPDGECEEPGAGDVFAGDEGGTYDIYTIALDGSKPVRLTGDDGYGQERYPCWSADGERLAYAKLEAGDWEVCTMKADGTEKKQLTDNTADDGLPAW